MRIDTDTLRTFYMPDMFTVVVQTRTKDYIDDGWLIPKILKKKKAIYSEWKTELTCAYKGGVMKKPDQCKGCQYLHNAGHKENKAMFKYNIWCAIASKPANKATGECKLNGWRKLGERYETIRSKT